MFTELLESYKEKGLKALKGIVLVKEEPTEDEFNKEIDIAQKKSEGKIRNKKIDNAAVQAVEITPKAGGLDEEKDEEKDEKDEDDKDDDKEDSDKDEKECNESESAHKGKSMWGEPRKGLLDNAKGGKSMSADEKEERHKELKKSAEEIKKKKYTMKDGKIVSEDVDDLQERKLSKNELDKRERIVMKLKGKMKDFKARYGDKAKSVAYAVATKQAKKK